MFDASRHKSLETIKEEILIFFDMTKEEYAKLNFSINGNWCTGELPDVRFTKNRTDLNTNFLSYPIFNNQKNKAIILSARDRGMQTVILAEKIKSGWVIRDDKLLSF